MNLSSYRLFSYVGLAIFPVVMTIVFYLPTQNLADAIVLAILFTIVIIPLQLWQLSRLQSRLDDHDGSIPLG